MGLREGIELAPSQGYQGVAFRHVGEAYSDRPLSGLGSYRRGGRFNPQESFPVLYLCTTYSCVTEEFWRRIKISGNDPSDLLPRVVYEYKVDLDAVLDLTDDSTLRHLRVGVRELIAPDRNLPQQIGDCASDSGLYQAILSYSATGVGKVLAILEGGLQGVTVISSKRWNVPGDI